jgi:hypothetical protein
MRVLGWALRLGCVALLVIGLVPAASVWIHAAWQEPAYAARDVARGGLVGGALLGMLGSGLLAMVMMRRVLVAAPPQPRLVRRFLADEGGLLVFEFALVFPFILSLVFILFQWAEILMCDSLLHYSAFCTARSASTYMAVPNPERFKLAPGTPKFKQLADTANFAMFPAMALEGVTREHRMTPKVTIFQNDANATPVVGTLEVQEVLKKRYQSVGVMVEWGLAPRWPVVGLFFRPLLVSGKIPMSRSYRMEVEPYVESDTLFPANLAYRHEKTRRYLHDTLWPVNHGTGFTRTQYSAKGTLEQKNLDRCPEGAFLGPLGSWGSIFTSLWGGAEETPTTEGQ